MANPCKSAQILTDPYISLRIGATPYWELASRRFFISIEIVRKHTLIGVNRAVARMVRAWCAHGLGRTDAESMQILANPYKPVQILAISLQIFANPGKPIQITTNTYTSVQILPNAYKSLQSLANP